MQLPRNEYESYRAARLRAIQKIAEKQYEKESLRDALYAGAKYLVRVDVDGQNYDAVVSVGHDNVRKDPVRPDLLEALTYVLQNVEDEQRRVILSAMAYHFKEKQWLPIRSERVREEVEEALEECTLYKTVPVRGSVRCKYEVVNPLGELLKDTVIVSGRYEHQS